MISSSVMGDWNPSGLSANIEHENGRVKSLVFDQGEPITDVVVNLIADCFELKRLRFTKASIEQRDWLILTELPSCQPSNEAAASRSGDGGQAS